MPPLLLMSLLFLAASKTARACISVISGMLATPRDGIRGDSSTSDFIAQLPHTREAAQFLELGRARLGVFKVLDFYKQILTLWQELVQRRIEQTDGDRQRFHRLEVETACCMGRSFLSASRRSFSLSARRWRAYGQMPIPREDTCRARRCFGANRRACLASRGMSALCGCAVAQRIDPAHELDQIRIVWLRGQAFELSGPLRGRWRRRARSSSGPAVGVTFDGEFLGVLVDDAVACAGHEQDQCRA